MYSLSVVSGGLVYSVVCAFLTGASAAVIPDEKHGSDQDVTGANGIFLFRFKREPEPQVNRAMTFTGFMPNGGMTAFSAASDPYQKVPQWYTHKPSDTLTPPVEDESGAEQEEPQWTKKSKKKPYNPSKHFPTKNTSEEDEEEYEPSSRNDIPLAILCRLPNQTWAVYFYCLLNGYKVVGGNGGNAAASFNAWFPIMFGGFPNQYSRNGQEKSDPESRRNSDFPGQTVIANSVSNGKGGVATSHAIAYGNRPEGRHYGAEQPKMQSLQTMTGMQGY